jgi:hypothetical protein
MIVQQQWIDMTDMQEFLLAAKKAIEALDKRIPGNISGPVANPLYRIATQLGAVEVKGKGLMLLRNVLLAAAMLLCTSATFKPIPIEDSGSNDESQAGDLISDAVVRYVIYCFNQSRM